MKKFFLILAFLSLFVFDKEVLATLMVSLEPSTQSGFVGGTLNYDVEISGLTASGPDSLGAFDLEITFDDSILAFNSAAFDSFLGNPDPSFFETITSVDVTTPSVVRLQEVSLLFDVELDALQGSNFSLANISFTLTDMGSSEIGLQNIVLSDAYGNMLSGVQSTGAQGSAVPEPVTILLLGSGLIGFAGLRRKLKK